VALEQSDATEVETVTETTQTPAESTTPEESTVPDQSTAPEETTTVDAETPANTETPAVEETTPVTTVVRKAAAKAAARSTSTDYDITDKMTANDSYMMVKVDGKYVNVNDLEDYSVDQGAPVHVHLEWDAIPGIQKGQNLVYQIPTDMMTNVSAIPREVFFDYKNRQAGYLTLSADGLLTVEIDESYFNTWSTNQGTDTLELDYLILDFYAALSMNHGETSGNDDNVIRFKDETEGEPQSAVEFEIPFKYPNENAKVNVEKLSTFDAATRTIHYTVTVTAPSDNLLTAENVKLTDVFTAQASYLSKTYQNVTATMYADSSRTNGTDVTSLFNTNTATMNIGEMAAGAVVVVEYDATVDDSYFSTTNPDPIVNVATVNFNDNGSASATSEQSGSGMATIAKDVGYVTQDTDGKYYIPYTVTVTATGDAVSNVVVRDVLSNGDKLVSELTDFRVGGADAGSACSYDSSTQTLTWNIGTMNGGETKILTYKGYLDMSVFEVTRSSTGSIYVDKSVDNTASLYVGGTLYGQAKGNKKISKTWVNKNGAKDKSTGNVNYTLKVNDFPSAANVTTISDALSGDAAAADSEAYIALPITVNVYKKTADGTKSLVKSLSVDESTTGFTYNSDRKGWSLDLETAKIQGTYYYEISYAVKETGSLGNVDNGVGIGLGTGVTMKETTSVEVKEVHASKDMDSVDWLNGTVSWTSTMMTNIEAGSEFFDYYDDDTVRDKGLWWFSPEDIDAIEVYWGDELIYSKAQGINLYDISIVPGRYEKNGRDDKWFNANSAYNVPQFHYGTDRTQSPTKTTVTGYDSYKIYFGKAIDTIESTKTYVYIKYASHISAENFYNAYRTTDSERPNKSTTAAFTGWMNQGEYPTKVCNRCVWTLSSGLSRTSESKVVYWRGNEDVLKGAKYDEKTGIITWKVFLNRQSDMIGEATLVDTIPDGLTYIDNSLELSYGDAEIPDYIENAQKTGQNSFYRYTTASSTKQQGDIKSSSYDDSSRTLTVNLENLVGYNVNSSNQYSGDWYKDGMVTITYQTRIDDVKLIQGGTLEFDNTATVTSDTMAFGSESATCKKVITVPTEPEKLTKTMDAYVSGYTLTFRMGVNSTGIDLISGEDTITVKDVMNEKLNLDMESIKITDGDGNVLTRGTDYTVTKVETTDGSTDNTYEFVLPDGKALTIEYEALMDGAIGETVPYSNKAYLEYEGRDENSYVGDVHGSEKIVKANASTSTSATPSFQIHKVDQDGNAVQGVTFTLYSVPLTDGKAAIDGSGNVTKNLVTTGTTNRAGYVTFEDLDDETVYCFEETSAPDGYVMDTTPQYLYFVYYPDTGLTNVLGISYNDKTFEVENTYSAASLTVPVQKTINHANKSSSMEFGFTMTKTHGDTVYTDEFCEKSELPLVTTVTGSGNVSFDPVYFGAVGTYKFTVKENALTAEQTSEGFSADGEEYTITVDVSKAADGSLYVASAIAEGKDGTTYDLKNGAVLPFNNTLTLTPANVTLKAYKKLTGDVDQRGAIKAGEFTFTAYDGQGQAVATGQTKAAGSDGVSEIEFTDITYDQDDVGTHYLLIKEDTGNDDSILYSTQSMVVKVQVDAGSGGKVAATVTYVTKSSVYNDGTDDYPLFENQYTYTEPDIVVSGVHVDFVPYVLVAAAVVVVGAGAGVVRWRRRKNED
jgi:hypothetical protein